MWMLKLRVYDKDCIYATKIRKLGLQAYEQILTHYKKRKSYYLVSAHILMGDSGLKNKYIREMKKDKKLQKVELMEILL